VIRRAGVQDIPEIVTRGAEFHATDRWSGLLTFDPASFEKTALALLENGAIFLSKRGLIGLARTRSIYNHAEPVCSEMFFWAPDGRGDQLRRAAEQWASGLLILGAHEPADPRIETWYRRAGFVPVGRQFAKVI
jgi:hypothetical protein